MCCFAVCWEKKNHQMCFLLQESVRHKDTSAEYSEGDCGSSWHLVSRLWPVSVSLSLFEDSRVVSGDAWWWPERGAHIRPRAPLIPIIHKFSQRDLYPPSALWCLLSVPTTSLWLLGRNEMPRYKRTQTHSHVWWRWQQSVSSTHLSLASLTYLSPFPFHFFFFFFYLLCPSFGLFLFPLSFIRATSLVSFLWSFCFSYSLLPLSLYLHFLTIFSLSLGQLKKKKKAAKFPLSHLAQIQHCRQAGRQCRGCYLPECK